MATARQKRAVDKIVENRGVGVSTIMAMPEVGYKPKTAKNPKNLTDSKGYKELLKEYGLTPGLVVRALVSDIKKKPKNRVKELNLGAEILKLKDNNEGRGATVQILIIPSEIAERHGVKINDTHPLASSNS